MNKDKIFEILKEATEAEVDEYLNAILNRKRELCPDLDIWYMSEPKESPEEQLELDTQFRKAMVADTLKIFYKFEKLRKIEQMKAGAAEAENWDVLEDFILLDEIICRDNLQDQE